MSWAKKTNENLSNLRLKNPLVHNITNFVVMNSTANILLATGASPIMAHAKEELEDIVKISNVLVINMGTLDPYWVDSILTAGKYANQAGVPVVFDPVGTGASQYRTDTAKRIIDQIHCSIIRANAGEMMSLMGSTATVRGVDSTADSGKMKENLKSLAASLDTVLAMTGIVDHVSNGKSGAAIYGGHELFKKVTGTGCAISAICGAFAAVETDSFTAAVCAMNYYGIAGQLAASKSQGPASFSVNLVDQLFSMTPSSIDQLTHIEEF